MQTQVGRIIKINGIFYNAANIYAVGPVSSAIMGAEIICPICGNDMSYIKETQTVNCRKCKIQIIIREELEFYLIVFSHGHIMAMTYQKRTEARESQKNLLAQWAIAISPPELLGIDRKKGEKSSSKERQ